jgi:hypothetical protein
MTRPNDGVPSVRRRYSAFNPTTNTSAPVRRIGTLPLVEFIHLRVSLGIDTTGSQVPYQSLNRGHATYMPSTSRAVSKTPPDFVPRHGDHAVLMEFLEFTTLHGWFTFVRLFDPYLTGFDPCLLASALTTRALYPRSLRWFAPCSCTLGHEGPSLIFDKASHLIGAPHGAPISAFLAHPPLTLPALSRPAGRKRELTSTFGRVFEAKKYPRPSSLGISAWGANELS